MLRKLGCGCLGVILLLAALIGYGVWQFTHAPASVAGVPIPRTLSPAEEAPLTGAPTSTERQAAQATLKRLQRQVQPAARPGAAGGRVRLSITEREVTQLIRGTPDVRKALGAANIRALAVRFRRGRVLVTARMPLPVMGLTAPVSAAATVGVADGRFQVTTEDVRVGSLPAPAQLRTQLDTQLTSALKDLNEKLAGRVERVTVDNGRLEVVGRASPE